MSTEQLAQKQQEQQQSELLQIPPDGKNKTSKHHIQHIGKSTENFFVMEANNDESAAAWENRRIRMASSMGHGLNENYMRTSKQDVTAAQEGTSKDADNAAIPLDGPRRKKSVLQLSMTAFEAENLWKNSSSSSYSDLSHDKLSTNHNFVKSYNLLDCYSLLQTSVKKAKKKNNGRVLFKDKKKHTRRSPAETSKAAKDEVEKDIVTTIKEGVLALTERGSRRRFGMGIAGEFFERKLRSSIIKSVKYQIDNLDDHRPYFSYWVTFVQTVIMIAAIALYGFAPIGIGISTITGNVHMPNLAIQTEYHMEVENLWIGPRQADLVHLGAKYSPCMREDLNLKEAIEYDRKDESQTACCIRKDGSGCVQMVKAKCDNILSTWLKWSGENPGPDGRVSGSVCGQDPRYCNNPSSSAPFEWPDEITKWPICIDAVKVNYSLAQIKSKHMHCEILGRPCCFGIQGECTITTVEHCNLLRGNFHGEAALCSQVNCIQELCGMIPFAQPKVPDQFYRLGASLFIHGGLLHLSISILFQMWVMRDLEKLLGTIRTVIIYFGSGVAGNLASCTFIPYTVEVGPSGAHFGIAACLVVEVIQSYQMFKHPHLAIVKLCLPIASLFILGLLPWVDNWAHLFGFFFGFLLAFSLMPYVTFGHFDRHRKMITVFVCLGAALVLFAMLIVIFYYAPLTDCQWCAYFNCIPLTRDFCYNMNVRMKKNSTYSKFI